MSVPAGQRAFEKVYAEVQQFYSRHIQLMDEGPAEEAVRTFTADASLLSPPKIAEPVTGHANLLAGLRNALAAWAEAGETYRRCYTMVSVVPQPDGRLHVRSYVQVIATAPGAAPRLHAMCVCEDVLVWEDGELKVYQRVVTRDDVR
ncbi:nuclear transport factor 2 family protein [Amycolatopsis sp. NPDC059027]|uniref:nuclear transport factor 2 family protein n=1 Tax=unclassified Amycolatopsis TaxID=2618356 RepID=UPI00366A96B6